ncbi:uncharacterized protein [Ptychodera flava]|uniref:uncharacterized protein n=1 Tax=Ptychodera flava TaxID=63121 RepID=UPI00396A92C7
MDLILDANDPDVRKRLDTLKYRGSGFLCVFWEDQQFGTIPEDDVLKKKTGDPHEFKYGDVIVAEYDKKHYDAIYITQGASEDELSDLAKDLFSMWKRKCRDRMASDKRKPKKKTFDDFFEQDTERDVSPTKSRKVEASKEE